MKSLDSFCLPAGRQVTFSDQAEKVKEKRSNN
jgi:hypothetical protein